MASSERMASEMFRVLIYLDILEPDYFIFR